MNKFLSLQATLGIYGVKTSLLMTNDDYWRAAQSLFGRHVNRTDGATLETLQGQIKAIPKGERKRCAESNLRNLRGDWVSEAACHQAKLRRVA